MWAKGCWARYPLPGLAEGLRAEARNHRFISACRMFVLSRSPALVLSFFPPPSPSYKLPSGLFLDSPAPRNRSGCFRCLPLYFPLTIPDGILHAVSAGLLGHSQAVNRCSLLFAKSFTVQSLVRDA